MNLSAPQILQQHNTESAQVIFYCDVSIGNQAEAEAWLMSLNFLTTQTKALAVLQKSNQSQPPLVIITHGLHPTVLVSSTDPDKLFAR